MRLIIDMPEAKIMDLELGDWPGGTVTAMECVYPDAPDGGLDLNTGGWCTDHRRNVWWCLNAGVFWCDGGPPDYEHHLCVFERMPDLPY